MRSNGKKLRTFRPHFESLERRELMAANITATLSNKILTIEGTDAADSISVIQSGSTFKVNNGNVKINVNGSLKTDYTGTVNEIKMLGLKGDDTLSMNTTAGGPVNVKGTLDGGPGKDLLIGGNGNDRLIGGTEADKIWGNGGFDTYVDDFDFTKPFLNGAAVSDVDQAGSYTCQTLAAIAEGVDQGFDFTKQITSKGGNKYEVKLPGATTQTVTFDGSWTDGDPAPAKDADGRNTREFWVILMQRARLQYLGVPTNQEWTDAFVEKWKTQKPDLTSASSALKHFTNKTTGSIDVAAANTAAKKEALAQDLKTRSDRKDLLVACSHPGDKKKTLNSDNIAYSHCYAVLDVRKVGSTWVVDLYNPWATDASGDTTLDTNKPTSRAVKNDGFITLTLDAFQRSFKTVATAK